MDTNPDIIVIQECENSDKLSKAIAGINYNELIWYGTNPNKGIAILSFNEYHISLQSDFNTEFEFVIPLTIQFKKKEINLLAIWAMPNKKSSSKSYVGQIWGAINYYEKMFGSDSIFAGDFNSNKIWDKTRKHGNHSDVVSFLRNKKIESLYHKFRKEEPGQEKAPTLFLLKNRKKKYHMDYCFASTSMITNKTTIEVGQHDDWIAASDHMPVWVNNLQV